MDAHQLWQTATGQLELQLARPTFDTWIKNTKAISYEDGVLVVGVHTAYAKDWLENRLYAPVQRTVSDIAKRTVKLRFIVQRNGLADEPEHAQLLSEQTYQARQAAPSDHEHSRVNPRYTFDSFIVGSSNRLACAGCVAVADEPGKAYNPLFIYGGVGLGKTHLLHAIGNRALQEGRKVLYVSAETFANEMINSIRGRTTEEFRAKYRTIDVLLLDDAQFLINKERTQEEFFHTFNDLYQENRQIVLSSDRPPNAFGGMEERLRSRLGWGLTVDVQPPDFETRIAILQTKAEERAVRIPADVIEFIAQQIDSNIRELEGALNRVLALARMMEYPLTVQTAQKALGEVMRAPTRVSMDDIMAEIAAYYELTIEDLVGPRRNRYISQPRQMIMYLARDLTEMSLPQIGEALGGRDHTTIMHGCDKISALFEQDDDMRSQVLEIKTRLYNGRQSETVPELRQQPQGVRGRAQ